MPLVALDHERLTKSQKEGLSPLHIDCTYHRASADIGKYHTVLRVGAAFAVHTAIHGAESHSLRNASLGANLARGVIDETVAEGVFGRAVASELGVVDSSHRAYTSKIH